MSSRFHPVPNNLPESASSPQLNSPIHVHHSLLQAVIVGKLLASENSGTARDMMGIGTACLHVPGSGAEGFICIVHFIPRTAVIQGTLEAERDKVTWLRSCCE